MINLFKFRTILEDKFNFDKIEHETITRIRFDIRGKSFWVNSSGKVENIVLFSKCIKSFVKKQVRLCEIP